jgi:hypothetical protein
VDKSGCGARASRCAPTGSQLFAVAAASGTTYSDSDDPVHWSNSEAVLQIHTGNLCCAVLREPRYDTNYFLIRRQKNGDSLIITSTKRAV